MSKQPAKGKSMSRCLRFGLFAVLVLTILAGSSRAAKPPEPISLWPKGAPGEKGDIGEEKHLPLKAGDTTIRITDVTRPTITVFRPPAEKDTGAAVLICPGGGYGILAFNKEGTEVADWLKSIGITGIVMKYRVPVRKGQERYAAPLQDAQRALGLIRHRAKEWGIKADRIGVLGFSAGGHLAATLSTNYEKRTYEAIDAADQESCRPDFTLLIYPAYLVAGKDANTLAPELKVMKETPRTFLVQTQDDGVKVECSLFYYLALRNAKVPAELHVYPTGGHGYGLRPSAHAVSTWPQRAETWMRSLGVLQRKE
jgi:acetyl esterase/lipase